MIKYSDLMIKTNDFEREDDLTPIMQKYLKYKDINEYLVPSIYEIPDSVEFYKHEKNVIKSIEQNELMRSGIDQAKNKLLLYKLSSDYTIPIINLSNKEVNMFFNSLYKYMKKNMFFGLKLNTALFFIKIETKQYLVLIANHIIQDGVYTAEEIYNGRKASVKYDDIIKKINSSFINKHIDMSFYYKTKENFINKYSGYGLNKDMLKVDTKDYFRNYKLGIFYPLVYDIAHSLFELFKDENTLPLCLLSGRPSIEGTELDLFGDFHDEILININREQSIKEFIMEFRNSNQLPYLTLNNYLNQKKNHNTDIEPIIISINFARDNIKKIEKFKRLMPKHNKKYTISIRAIVSLDVKSTVIQYQYCEYISEKMENFGHTLIKKIKGD